MTYRAKKCMGMHFRIRAKNERYLKLCGALKRMTTLWRRLSKLANEWERKL